METVEYVKEGKKRIRKRPISGIESACFRSRGEDSIYHSDGASASLYDRFSTQPTGA